MAAVSCVLSEDQFRCPICLEVFTAPVTTPCGHNFCKQCIEQHWDLRLQCPVCNEPFSTRPKLKTNTAMAEMVSQFKSNPPIEEQAAGLKRSATALEDGDVPCDLCSEPRLKALKSCVMCLASFCPDHLQPHVSNPRLKMHQLIEAGQNLDERICPEHNAPLDMFCRSESKIICLQCFSDQHKAHSAVPLKEQREANEAKLKDMIQNRRQKVKEIQSSVELSQRNADQEIQDGVKVFESLMASVQRSLTSFKKTVEEKHKKTEREAAELIKKIQTEIMELEQKATELEELSGSEDHFHVLQKFNSAKYNVVDWAKVSISVKYEEILHDSVISLNKQFIDECKKVFMAKLYRLKRFHKDVTFDSNAVHEHLEVSKDRKQVSHIDKKGVDKRGVLPNFRGVSERFRSAPYVWGIQKFSSGQFYFEAVVKGKIMWAVGVADEPLQTTTFGGTPLISLHDSSQKWLMTWDNEEYYPASIDGRCVSVKSIPETIGVFVNYEERSVSFYDAGTAVFIGSIQNCWFRGNIQPIFSPGEYMDGKNKAPLRLDSNCPFYFFSNSFR